MIDQERSEREPIAQGPLQGAGSLHAADPFGGTEPAELSSLSDTVESTPIGEYLRRQRVLRGISIEELSALTRIPLRSLERLECGEFDGETDGFVRGFVRTVAAAVGLDADDTIARMLKEPTPGVWERHQSGRRLKQSAVGLALLVVGLIAFLVLQAGWRLLVGIAPGRVQTLLVLDDASVQEVSFADQLEAASDQGDPMRSGDQA